MNFFAATIYEDAGIENTTLATFGFGLSSLFSNILLVFFFKQFNFYKTIYISLFFHGIGLIIFTIGEDISNVIMILFGSYLYSFTIGIGIGGVFFFYLSCIVPPEMISYCTFAA